MPSQARALQLLTLLQDADELNDVHTAMKTGNPGRQWGLGALNRAVVVLCVSAWESYVEQVIIEAIEAMRPPSPTPPGEWTAVNVKARSLIGNFNNPNVEKVRRIIQNSLGLPDITLFWFWRRCTVVRACNLLTEAVNYRHEIAHGVNPRPVIHSQYATDLPKFFQRLAEGTDKGIRDHFVSTLRVAEPWPA